MRKDGLLKKYRLASETSLEFKGPLIYKLEGKLQMGPMISLQVDPRLPSMGQFRI